MTVPTALTRFTADDLARAPALLDAVLGELIGAGRLAPDRRAAPGQPSDPPLAPALTRHRQRLVADYRAALAQRVHAGSGRADGSAPVARAERPSADVPLTLTLVDEDTIAADVQAARVADLVKVVAEYELRELGALLAALAGDDQVTCHRLALQPEVHARALRDAAGQLPEPEVLVPKFMNEVARPMADALRRHWAAACARLEDAGVVPAAYRTVILQAGLRVEPEAPASDWALPAPGLVPRGHGLVDGPGQAAPAVAAVARIFDALQNHPRIGADFKPALSHLRDPALRAAGTDPALATAFVHPLWALVDRIVWQGECLPPPPQRERVRTMQVINGLVDQLVSDEQPGTARFAWALERLARLEQNRFARRIEKHAAQVTALTVVDRDLAAARLAGPAEPPPSTDLGELPTVPADLYASQQGALDIGTADTDWIDALGVGDLARLQIEGRWVLAQLLWRSAHDEIFLWARCAGPEAWPVRRGALRQLFAGGLAVPTTPARTARDTALALSRRDTEMHLAA